MYESPSGGERGQNQQRRVDLCAPWFPCDYCAWTRDVNTDSAVGRSVAFFFPFFLAATEAAKPRAASAATLASRPNAFQSTKL